MTNDYDGEDTDSTTEFSLDTPIRSGELILNPGSYGIEQRCMIVETRFINIILQELWRDRYRVLSISPYGNEGSCSVILAETTTR